MKKSIIVLTVFLLQLLDSIDAQKKQVDCPTQEQVGGTEGKILTIPGAEKTFPTECTIKFRETGKAVNLTFSKFQLGNDCKTNFIEVGNGDGANVDKAQKFCGNTLPMVPISTEELMFIKITAATVQPEDTLVVKYQQADVPTPLECSDTENQVKLNQEIIWPPRDKTVPTPCTYNYKIAASSAEKRIKLTFANFRIPDSADCTDYYVMIGNGELSSGGGKKYCGTNAPNEIVSDGDKMFISIKADELPWGNFIQFTATETNSGQSEFTCESKTFEATETAQNLVVPSTGSKLPTEFECTYAIKASEGKLLQLDFMQFKMGSSTTCDTEYVIVGEGEKPGESEGKKLCGQDKPEIPVNNVPAVYVYVKGKKLTENDGFTLSYKSGAAKIPSFGLLVAFVHFITYQ